MDENEVPPRESLLPYDAWAAAALRQVAVQALAHVARHGLPGGHHFFLTFRTDHPGVEMPAHLRQRFPDEMTIVLQHQFWDLAVDEAAGRFRVGLGFGGVPAALVVPFAALSAFADPEVQFGLRFVPVAADQETLGRAVAPLAPEASSGITEGTVEPAAGAPEAPQVVSLDAFRRRPPGKE